MLLMNDWQSILADEMKKDYFVKLMRFVEQEYMDGNVYPEQNHLFQALSSTSFENTRVVLLGQDPYHGPGQAHGLSFSVPKGVSIPPSLRNMYKELAADLECEIPSHGCLQSWAEQGVLLLNTVLTVRDNQAGSHQGKGWETFTDTIINAINLKNHPVIFLLWGRHAQSKLPLIDTDKHRVIESAHPSPLSAHRGFLGSKPYSRTNQLLEEANLVPIYWPFV
jgi:uracil-DNA glycosylase